MVNGCQADNARHRQSLPHEATLCLFHGRYTLILGLIWLDYNTATFPSKKYYNLEVWEALQHKEMISANRKDGQVDLKRDEEELRYFFPYTTSLNVVCNIG